MTNKAIGCNWLLVVGGTCSSKLKVRCLIAFGAPLRSWISIFVQKLIVFVRIMSRAPKIYLGNHAQQHHTSIERLNNPLVDALPTQVNSLHGSHILNDLVGPCGMSGKPIGCPYVIR